MVAGAPSVTLTDLDEFTCYDYYIIPNCGVDVVSCRGEKYSCCTPEMCPGPYFVTPDSITNESFDLTWVYADEAVFYEVEWGLEGFVLGTGTTMEIYPFETCHITDLEAYECYDV